MTEINILYITNIPTPYKRPRLNALSGLENVEVTVYYLAQSNHRHEFEELPDAEFDIIYGSPRKITIRGTNLVFNLNSFRKILSSQADVYVVGGWNHLSAWTALLASKLNDVPIGIISANTEQGGFSRHILSRLLSGFDFYLALSDLAKENYADLGISAADITVLPNAIDVSGFQSEISRSTQKSLRRKWNLPESGVVLYVGNLEFDKGVHNLVEAISTIDEPCHLLIIGDGPYRTRIETLTKQLNNISVTFTGQLPNSELPNYYALSDLSILPTHSDTWGLVVNEALACGTPVVSTTAAGVSGELLQHRKNGLVVPPKDPGQLAEAIEYLLSNDEVRSQYQSIGREQSLRYTPQKYAEGLVGAIDSVISSTG